MEELKEIAGSLEETIIIDSSFESGNLDMAVQIDKNEYDMYMRVDSNTRGHHQWFYFKIQNKEKVGKVTFNFVNFTKRQSLYMHGMRVNVKSMLDIEEKTAKLPEDAEGKLPNDGWVKTGNNITYKVSKLNNSSLQIYGNQGSDEIIASRPLRRKKYY